MRLAGSDRFAVVLAVALFELAPPAWAARPIRWRQLQAGLHYAAIHVVPPAGVNAEDQHLRVVKLDAGLAGRLRVALASEGDHQARTAEEWSRQQRLAVTINLGMYYEDHLTHVGYLRHGKHSNSKRWLPKYESLLIVGQHRARIVDRTVAAPDARLVVQNLRLIRSPDGLTGQGVWSQPLKPKRWSEAALATDGEGNLLFVFSRVPFSMWEFARLLLSLPLGIVRAMHLEGGPEASLSIHAGGVDLDLCGSYETGFFRSDLNAKQWPIPNVLGVASAAGGP